MTAREGGAERGRERIQRRSRPVGEVLDRQRQRLVASHHDGYERDDPATWHPDALDSDYDECEPCHERPGTEPRHDVEAVIRQRARVHITPLGDAGVELPKLR